MFCPCCKKTNHIIDDCYFAHPVLRRSRTRTPQHVAKTSLSTPETTHSRRRHSERDIRYAPQVSTRRSPSTSIQQKNVSDHNDDSHDCSLELSDLRALEVMLGPGIRDAARENQRHEHVVNDLRAEVQSLHERIAELCSTCTRLEMENEELASTVKTSKDKLKALEDDLQAAHTRGQEQQQAIQVADEAAKAFAADISALYQSQAILAQERDEAYLTAQTISQELGEIRVLLQAEIISYDGEQHDEFTELLRRLQTCQQKRKRHTAALLQQMSNALPIRKSGCCTEVMKFEGDGTCEVDHSDSDAASPALKAPGQSSEGSQVVLADSSLQSSDPRKRPRLDHDVLTQLNTS